MMGNPIMIVTDRHERFDGFGDRELRIEFGSKTGDVGKFSLLADRDFFDNHQLGDEVVLSFTKLAPV